MAKHAILSPSGANRWMTCTPSARLTEKYPETSSTYADEGTFAHAVAELILRDPDDFKEQLEKLKQSKLGKLYWSDELFGYADEFAHHVRRNCTGDHFLFIEQRVDFTRWVPEGFGTADATVVKDKTLYLDDLKYGQGIAVDAYNNPQLKIYALGALEAFGMLYDIEEVCMSIFQPRLDNISEWTIPVSDLLEWAEKELKPKADEAWEGKGEFKAGEHCRFCPHAPTCRALANHNLKIAEHEFFGEDPADDDPLTLEEIADLLKQGEHIQLWLKLLQDYAFKKALEGERVPGYKLVEGRSIRKYTDENGVRAALIKAGFSEEDITTKPTLLGITALQKAIKKKAFTEFVEPLLEKPPGAPTLVPEDDKRPEWGSADTDFGDMLEGGKDG